MTYLSSGAQGRLQQAFIENSLSIDVKSDHIVVENSENQAEEKVSKIVESAGFYPLISKNKIDNNFVLTIVPYKIPDFFAEKQASKIPSDIEAPLTLKKAERETNYLKSHEISELLECASFVGEKEFILPKDRWSQVNNFRSFVTSALSKGISEIILKNINSENPILEIGSGIGYSLSENLRSKTIRTQPSVSECHLLSKSISDPIYQLDIEGIYKCLLPSEKKIPLFFALDVFDTMPPIARKESFFQLSQIQNSGDRILIMLDTNPCFDVTLEQLESLYPEHAIFPYYPLTNDPAKFSVIIVPIEYVQHKPSQSELLEIINQESMAIMSGRASQMQHGLHQLQKKLNLKVINLEDFFVEQVKKELKQAGYKSNVYYHASFEIGDLPKGLSGIKQDLVYRPVTDTATVRQWSLTDEKLVTSLDKKGLSLPVNFNEDFLINLREKGKKIFGAEILVVEATKI